MPSWNDNELIFPKNMTEGCFSTSFLPYKTVGRIYYWSLRNGLTTVVRCRTFADCFKKTGSTGISLHFFLSRSYLAFRYSYNSRFIKCPSAEKGQLLLLIFSLVSVSNNFPSWLFVLPLSFRALSTDLAALRIRDILVWIRIRGSIPLTNGPGSGSWSWPSRRQQKNIFSFKVFLHITFWRYIYIIFTKGKKS